MDKKRIVIGDQVAAYYTSGGTDDCVLFLHGWRSEGKVWDEISKLTGNARIYAIDLPGFGETPAPKKPFYVSDYAEFTAEFMEKLGLGGAVVVGHSFGGRIAIKLAVARPDLVSKLVLAGSAGVREKSAVREMMKVAAKIIRPVFALPFMRGVRRKIYTAIGAEDYIATPELKETFKNIINEDLTPMFGDIKQPTLVVWGDKDTETPVAHGEKMARLIPNARFSIIKGAGHFVFADKPREFADILNKFIK